MPPTRNPVTGQMIRADIAARGAKLRSDKEVKGIAGMLCNALTYAGLGLIGLTIGALIGYVAGKGVLTLMCGAIGLLAGLFIAVFVTGDFGDAVNAGGEAALNVTEPLVPSFAREVAYGHDAFSLLVTVHSVKTNADDILSLKLSNFDGYVVVSCGSNPVKKTCVSDRCQFEETFKLRVRPRDKGITFELRDQEVISDDQIGSCEIPFRNIIETGFPVMKAYSLFDHRDNKVGNLMLSFDWCDDFPADRLLYLQQQHPAEFERRTFLRNQALQSQTTLKAQEPAYGTFIDQSRVFAAGRGP